MASMTSGAPSMTALKRGLPYSLASAGMVVRNGTMSSPFRTVWSCSLGSARSWKSMVPPVMATSFSWIDGTGIMRYFRRSEKL